MFGAPTSNGLTFTKVIGGISKTLNLANQLLPLYREAKPMLNNAKTVLAVLKDFNKNNNSKTSIQKPINDKLNLKKEKDTFDDSKIIRNNNPSFFL